MDKFTTLEGVAAPLDQINVDTDMIIPKQYLKTTKRTGLGKGLFAEKRYRDDGSENPDFVLNKPAYRKAKILVAGDNFGCGSSREHAPWALQDFGIFRTAALAVVHGRSPYVTPSAAAFAHFDKFVYPPIAALVFAPFAALPPGAARVLMFVVGLAAILGALRILGVEDWRCYSVAIVSAPAINTLALGALTSLLLLGAAVVWRYRDRAGVAAVRDRGPAR